MSNHPRTMPNPRASRPDKDGDTFCYLCAIAAKTQWKKQADAGTPDEEIVVTPPNRVYTWQPAMQGGFPVVIPVCLGHLNVDMGSALIH